MLVVLAALPYPLFQLDRYTFVKELVLLAAALAAVLSCLAPARGLTVFMVDALISGFLALSLISALFAENAVAGLSGVRRVARGRRDSSGRRDR